MISRSSFATKPSPGLPPADLHRRCWRRRHQPRRRVSPARAKTSSSSKAAARHRRLLTGALRQRDRRPPASRHPHRPHPRKGGTTVRWGGQILELDAEDFERRDWIPESGWPFPRPNSSPSTSVPSHLEGLAGVLPNDAAVWATSASPTHPSPTSSPISHAGAPSPTSRASTPRPSRPATTSTSGSTPTPSNSSSKDDTVRGLRIRTHHGIETTLPRRPLHLLPGRHRKLALLPPAPRRRSSLEPLRPARPTLSGPHRLQRRAGHPSRSPPVPRTLRHHLSPRLQIPPQAPPPAPASNAVPASSTAPPP